MMLARPTSRSALRHRAAGLTLVELIVATSILLVLTTLALPLARVQIERQKEHQLRVDL